MSTATSSPARTLTIPATLACGVAALLAYNLPPSATLFNQVAALIGWGLFVVVLQSVLSKRQWSVGAAGPALLALGLMMASALASVGVSQLPSSLAVHAVALILSAMVLLMAGVATAEAGYKKTVLTALCVAWVLVGMLTALVCVVQVFFPAWADGDFIARSGLPGRAISNMRQPNHLASLLMWSCVAAIWLHEVKLLGRGFLLGVLVCLVFSVVLSASRTGMAGVALLALWGLLDGKKLSSSSRWSLALTPLMLAASWGLMNLWAQSGHHAFGAAQRLAEGAGSPSRLAILANAWELVKERPLTGVGWGEFNLAWTMTAFPNRPTAFFDHTHNLPMQLMVEMGLPLALLCLGLMGWSVWRAFMASQRVGGRSGLALRCAFMMVLMIGGHSLLEYPLWYAYFLLPTALFLGLCLGRESQLVEPTPSEVVGVTSRWALPDGAFLFAGFLMMVGGLLTVLEYRSVVVIYAPPAGAAPLDQRIVKGQRSWLFAPQADYAAATTFPPGPEALAAAKRTAHNLIDVRLMMAWAQSLHATGDDERASYVVERLREFRSPQAEEWLAVCEQPLAAGATKPFQCEAATRLFDYREMR